MIKSKKIFLSIILILTTMLLFTGCAQKTALTDAEFKTKAESMGYTVHDISEQYAEYEQIETATLAQSEDGYNIEFYTLTSEKEAVSMFNLNKEKFKSYKSGSSSETSLNSKNSSKYVLISSGSFMCVSTVDDTLIYIDVDTEYKDAVKEFLKEIEY